jgi:hypothetical protein
MQVRRRGMRVKYKSARKILNTGTVTSVRRVGIRRAESEGELAEKAGGYGQADILESV